MKPLSDQAGQLDGMIAHCMYCHPIIVLDYYLRIILQFNVIAVSNIKYNLC